MRFQALSILLTAVLTLSLTTASAHAKATVPLGHVEVRGSGPIPMVLISGPTLDWRYWEGFMDRNGDRYTMYAVTLPGMSGSEAMPMPAPWTPKDRAARQDPPMGTPWLDNAVEAVADMMIERCPGPAVVMGHAMGGTLALRLGIEHPRLVSAVVSLEGPVAYPVSREVTKKERTEQALTDFAVNLGVITPEEWPAQMRKWTLTGISNNPDYVTNLLNHDNSLINGLFARYVEMELKNGTRYFASAFEIKPDVVESIATPADLFKMHLDLNLKIEYITQMWSQENINIAEFVTMLSLDTDREVVIRYMVEHYMTDLTDDIGELRVPTLGIFTAISAVNMQSLNGVKKSQFGPAWHEEVRFYETDDISYFYNLKRPERFDTEIAEFLRAQNITGNAGPGEGDR